MTWESSARGCRLRGEQSWKGGILRHGSVQGAEGWKVGILRHGSVQGLEDWKVGVGRVDSEMAADSVDIGAKTGGSASRVGAGVAATSGTGGSD